MITPTTRKPPRWQPTSEPLRLGERLIQSGLVSAGDIESALQHQSSRNNRLGEVLIDLGIIQEADLLPILGEQFGVPALQLRDGVVDPQVIHLLPRKKAESLPALALFKVRDTLTVAMADPQNLHALDEIERLTGLKVRPVFVLEASLRESLDRYYDESFEVDALTADVSQHAVEVNANAVAIELQGVDAFVEESPVINLVNYIIVHAVRQGASDIHIEPGQQNSLVRFRVDGQLREVIRPRREFHPGLVSRIKVMSKLDIAEHRVPQDGRLNVVVEGRQIDLRISTLPTVLGEKVVLRLLDRANITFNLNDLGVPMELLVQFKAMLARPHGLLLVTGPTGSGKTTTLYSAVELIKSVHRNFITVEDPVEYQLELINQVHANPNIDLTFANVLRSILRQDPDVIMVGEIRDAETAEVAIQAALTGHLVLSTLHTNDSAGAITRLLDMGVAAYKISSALVGVVAQRLVRKICPHCKTPYYPPTELLQQLQYAGDFRKQFLRSEGCRECFDTGFRGRVGIYEILQPDRTLRDMILQIPSVDAIEDWHARKGGTNLLKEGLRLAEKGITSLDEVMRVTTFE